MLTTDLDYKEGCAIEYPNILTVVELSETKISLKLIVIYQFSDQNRKIKQDNSSASFNNISLTHNMGLARKSWNSCLSQEKVCVGLQQLAKSSKA